MRRTFARWRILGQTLLASTALACDRSRLPDASADTPALAPDTVVRRVARVQREPSAIQRVTGRIVALSALRPLDSALAVRVLDRRGLEMTGVRVGWSMHVVGDGATLEIVNARTDTAGMSRARFTPGSSAVEQTAIAEVPNVGRITFGVIVPAKSIRLIPEREPLWSGDSGSVVAELRDVNGTPLSGAVLGWTTTDSNVLRVVSRGDRGVVRGYLAGYADVVAWIEPGVLRGRARVRVAPVVVGRFVTVDGSDVPSMHAELRVGARRESLTVRRGQFSSHVETPPGDDLELFASPRTDSAVHAVRLGVPTARALQNLVVSLVPKAWRIARGSYEGQTVAIDARRALQRAEGGASFWRLVPISGQHPRKLLGWPETELPLRIAFDRVRSREGISAEDSIHFWRIAAQMERDLGGRYFVPAQMSSDTAASRVIPVQVGSNLGAGHTFVSWSTAGDAFDAVLTFRNASILRDVHVVTHELLHLLGFGHTASWPSVLRATGGTEERLTPGDVAHAQLAFRLRQLQHETGARPGLP